MINGNLSEVCDRRVNRRRERGRWASGATGQRGCKPKMMSSRVPAGGGFLAVRCQLIGQYGASRRNREGGTRGRIASGLATTD